MPPRYQSLRSSCRLPRGLCRYVPCWMRRFGKRNSGRNRGIGKRCLDVRAMRRLVPSVPRGGEYLAWQLTKWMDGIVVQNRIPRSHWQIKKNTAWNRYMKYVPDAWMCIKKDHIQVLVIYFLWCAKISSYKTRKTIWKNKIVQEKTNTDKLYIKVFYWHSFSKSS